MRYLIWIINDILFYFYSFKRKIICYHPNLLTWIYERASYKFRKKAQISEEYDENN